MGVQVAKDPAGALTEGGGMSIQLPRPELKCFDDAMRLPFQEVARRLRGLLGARLVAYIGSVRETRAVRQWGEGRRPGKDVETRLRHAYAIAQCIADADGAETAQAWFQGLNPMLDDVSPARLLREGDLAVVVPAVRTAQRQFLANG